MAGSHTVYPESLEIVILISYAGGSLLSLSVLGYFCLYDVTDASCPPTYDGSFLILINDLMRGPV